MSKRTGIAPPRVVRCAIYTRKSTEEGLEKEFNSLDAQRESAEAYIASQRAEGWICLPDRYDDGGFTGGNVERPALRRLLADIEAGRVDCIVVYKVDRLSRSLMDFSRMMELFERRKVAFVAVTQQFNTCHSMGRLTLNILLSFAQFEREIISERTRDKIAASRRKGKWSGGRSMLGYDVDPATRKLVVNEAEARLVREIFTRYLEGRSLMETCREFERRGLRTKAVAPARGKAYGGRPWDKPAVLKVLTNVLYAGRVPYKDETFPGEHAALVDEPTWKAVQELLRHNGRSGGMLARNKHGALLKGLLRCAPCDRAMGHTTTAKAGNRLYRYYKCQCAQKRGVGACSGRALPADQIEAFVVEQIKRIGRDPALLSLTLSKVNADVAARAAEAGAGLAAAERELARLDADLAATAADAAASPHAVARLADLHERTRTVVERASGLRGELDGLGAGEFGKAEVDAALARFDGVWSRLAPREQATFLRMLVQRVDYDATKGAVSITFHPLGLRSIGDAAARGEAA